MTLVMTLLARDEIDVVDSWLAFHLNAGADLAKVAGDSRTSFERAIRKTQARKALEIGLVEIETPCGS